MKKSFLKFTTLFSLLSIISLSTYAQIHKNSDNSALVIIDMQPYFVDRGGHQNEIDNAKKINEILDNQVLAIEEAKKAGIPIIFIEYDLGKWAKSGIETNARLTEAAKGYKNQKTFLKNSDGMFEYYNNSKEEIIKYLDNLGVKNLIITGANGGACVASSIEGSLALGKYNVYAYSKGIADFNYNEFIYPYDDKYNFKSNNSCSFEEVDLMSEVINVINFSTGVKVAENNTKIDDSDRGNSDEKTSDQTKPVITNKVIKL